MVKTWLGEPAPFSPWPRDKFTKPGLLLLADSSISTGLQGDHSGCDKPPIDTKPNVVF